MRLTWEEIAKATGGTILAGAPKTVVSGFAQDSRLVQPQDLFFPLVGPNRDGHDFLEEVADKGVRAFLISRAEAEERLRTAVSEKELHLIFVDNTQKALEDLTRFVLSKLDLKIVGVTGSTGKTSTRDMTARVLARRYRVGVTAGNFNTDIGMCLTILGMEEGTEVAVLEMGMDHAGDIAKLVRLAPPSVALITNIGISHMENLGSREGIFRAKMEIAGRMGKDDMLIVTEGPDYLTRASIEDHYGAAGFGLQLAGEGPACDLRLVDIREEGADGVAFDLVLAGVGRPGETARQHFHLPVPGRHNAQNAALAVGAGLALGVSMEEAAAALSDLTLTGARLAAEKVGGCTLLDDTYNASPDSARAAIDVLMSVPADHHYAVLLDMLELGEVTAEEHRKVGAYAQEKGVDEVLTCGDCSAYTTEGAGEAGRHFDSKEDIVKRLRQIVRPGDALLFKGSRAMRAETIFAALRETLAATELEG